MGERTTDLAPNAYQSETFTLSAEEEIELLASIAEVERGEWLSFEVVQKMLSGS
jgi:hypothetical protein